MSFHAPAYANARPGLKGLRFRKREPAPTAFRHDSLRERMLAAGIEAGREAQQLRLVVAFRRRRGTECRASFRECAGLVDDERIDLAQLFDGLRVAEQDSGRRGASR